MKRGEVVDAETAVKIAFWPDFRAVIWPDRLVTQALSNGVDVNLSDFPCRRKLMHLWCCPEGVFVFGVQPLIGKEEYGVQVVGWMADYDGALSKGSKFWRIYVETEIAKQWCERRFADIHNSMTLNNHQLNRFFEVIVLESELAVKGQPDPDFKLHPLFYAVALEKFAFSPRTSFKQREPSKQTMNRSPFLKRWPPIEIINLRLPEKKENPDSEGRELTIRFYVKGHFRRQWRPSTKDHKLIWIDEHIRGPKDAPLKPKPTKVYKVTR